MCTPETTWTKPLELSDPDERKAREAAENEKMSFFKDMEKNMKAKLKVGLTQTEVARASGRVGVGASARGGSAADAAAGLTADAIAAEDAAAATAGVRGAFSVQGDDSGLEVGGAGRKGGVSSDDFFTTAGGGGSSHHRVPVKVRTISTVDDLVLEQVRSKRVVLRLVGLSNRRNASCFFGFSAQMPRL